jgi:hypothetical protein
LRSKAPIIGPTSFSPEAHLMLQVKSCRTFLLVACFLAIAISAFAQDHSSVRVTNSDVVKMVKAGVPEAVIVRTIQVSEPAFALTPDALVELKHKHVPDRVLGAMMENQTGPSALPPGVPIVEYWGPPVATTHIHQLPNVDASFRIDGKTSEKVQVRKSQIKIEKAGVPLFSVKWKVNEK